MRRSFSSPVFFAALAALVASGLTLSPRSAEAAKISPHFVAPGVLFGFNGRPGSTIKGILGAEVSYTYYPWEAYTYGIGGFAQVNTVGFDHVRVAFGPQVNYVVAGAELGVFIEEGDDAHGTALGLQVAPFLSVGFVSTSLRIGVPVYAGGTSRLYGVDVGLTFTLKWPIPLDGDYIGGFW